MNVAAAGAAPGREYARVLLVSGVVMAALAEAVAGTALALARSDAMGDTHATPDEFAALDIGYTAAKLVAFMAAPWLLKRFDPRLLVAGATLAMAVACGVAAATGHLQLLVVLRIVQGLAGGVLLVGGQALLFFACARHRQPAVQALFAMGSVVAPATLAPALQGWLVDAYAWNWIFAATVPVALVAAGLMLAADVPAPARRPHRLDWIGLALVSIALCCFTYVLAQGNRWDWFEEPHIAALAATGGAALLAFLGQQLLAGSRRLLDRRLFASADFSFAFAVSFVAGAALFGSAYLIPAFAVSVLGFTATDAGLLLLPGSALFVGALVLAAYLMQVRQVPPVATVPFGILSIMAAMWMLSGSNGESGAADMMAALLLRGLGLGLLFLSITLIAFGGLARRHLASGIGLFNAGRLLGGLIGVAALQTMIHHDTVANATILGGHLQAGSGALAERLATSAAMLASEGLDAGAAHATARQLLGRAITGQSTVIAFDSAFVALALLFVCAAPLLVAIRIGLGRRAAARAPR